MKKIIYLLTIGIMSVSFVACDDKVEDEIFTKTVLLTKNGYQDYIIDYEEDGTTMLPLAVSVSGTSYNNKNIDVTIATDPDTLSDYNFEKYRAQKNLYYLELPEDCYTIESKTTTIKSGTEYGLIPIGLNLSNINKYERYVLPLAITNVSDYQIAKSAFSKVLIRIILQNKFSGNYSGSPKVHDLTNGGDPLNVTSKSFDVVDYNTCFFYAGNVDEKHEQKDKFIVKMTVDPATNNVALTADNPDLDFHQEDAKIAVDKRTEPTNLNEEIVTTTITLKYTYKDISNPDNPLNMRFEGVMVLIKRVGIG